MKATVTAVLAAEPGVAYPPVVHLNWPRGADGYIDVFVTDDDGAAVDISDAVGTMAVRESDSSITTLFTREWTVISGAAGHARFYLTASDTSALTPATRRWDFWMATVDGRVPILKASNFVTTPAVVLPDDVGSAPVVSPFIAGSVDDLAALALVDCSALGPGRAIFVENAGSGVAAYFHIEVPTTAPVVDGSTVVAALNLAGAYWVRGLGT
jgi:hypothetical protein